MEQSSRYDPARLDPKQEEKESDSITEAVGSSVIGLGQRRSGLVSTHQVVHYDTEKNEHLQEMACRDLPYSVKSSSARPESAVEEVSPKFVTEEASKASETIRRNEGTSSASCHSSDHGESLPGLPPTTKPTTGESVGSSASSSSPPSDNNEGRCVFYEGVEFIFDPDGPGSETEALESPFMDPSHAYRDQWWRPLPK